MFNFLWRQKEKTEVNTYTLTIIIIGIFAGLSGIFYFGGITFIRIDTVFNMVIISGLAVFLIHAPFLKKMNRFLIEVIVYCLAGWGLIIAALILMLNYIIHSQPEVNIYQVQTAIAHPEERTLPFPITVTLNKQGMENETVNASEYDDFGYMLKFEGEEEQKFKEKPIAAFMTTAKGVFGYRILIHKELH